MDGLKKAWKVARWVIFGALVMVIGLMMKTPPPIARVKPAAEVATDSAAFQTKLGELAQAQQAHESATLHLSEDEVNAALKTAGEQAAATAAKSGADLPPIQESQVAFHEDTVVGRFQTEVYGKSVTVLVAGKLGAKDGYVTFEPTEFKIGDMPVPVSLVDSQLQKKLLEPENREKLKLPEFISDVRVQNGELIVINKPAQ